MWIGWVKNMFKRLNFVKNSTKVIKIPSLKNKLMLKSKDANLLNYLYCGASANT